MLVEKQDHANGGDHAKKKILQKDENAGGSSFAEALFCAFFFDYRIPGKQKSGKTDQIKEKPENNAQDERIAIQSRNSGLRKLHKPSTPPTVEKAAAALLLVLTVFCISQRRNGAVYRNNSFGKVEDLDM